MTTHKGKCFCGAAEIEARSLAIHPATTTHSQKRYVGHPGPEPVQVYRVQSW